MDELRGQKGGFGGGGRNEINKGRGIEGIAFVEF
jgi:hypothetical protein